MEKIHFGTDGWRGRIAEDYTFANIRRCAQGFAAYLLNKGARMNGWSSDMTSGFILRILQFL